MPFTNEDRRLGASDKFAKYLSSQHNLCKGLRKLHGTWQLMFMALITALDHKTLPMPVFRAQPGGTKVARNVWEGKKAKKSPMIRNIKSSKKPQCHK